MTTDSKDTPAAPAVGIPVQRPVGRPVEQATNACGPALRPILFSAPMVRALLSGTKTQTRRPLRPGTWWTPEHGVIRMAPAGLACTGFALVPCPYGQPGDRLWVREAFSGSIAYERHGYPLLEWGNKIWFWADGNPQRGDWTKPRPSIHMPRHLSRITLEVTEVRVERLQDISEADAQAEGIAYSERFNGYCIGEAEHFNSHDPRLSYFSLWESINGPGSVEAIPWVWVVEFRRIQQEDSSNA